MTKPRNVLSPRSNNDSHWVPGCIGFGCGDSEFIPKEKTTKSAPILILKGLGTMTLGRIGEGQNILRDDIVTWKRRIEDSLYIGWITYTTTPSTPEEVEELPDDVMVVMNTNGDGSDYPSIVTIDDVKEHKLRKVEKFLAAEKGLSKDLTQLLKVLLNRDFSGALRLVNDFIESTVVDENTSPNTEDTITKSFAMHNKAVLEMANGVFKYAVYYFKESADIKENLLGPSHKSVLETCEQLAIAMYGMGAYDECHGMLRTIHSRSESKALAARTWNAIACLHFQKGDQKFAFKCVSRAVVLHESSEAADLASTIALANMGYMQLANDLEEAQATLVEADEKLSKWLGANNEIVQSVRYNMDR